MIVRAGKLLDTRDHQPSPVSNVDGFNLPMRINTDVKCPNPTCDVDLAASGCPHPSLQIKDSQAKVAGMYLMDTYRHMT